MRGYKMYLEKKGYSVVTPSGKPSTVDDYAGRVERICDREGISLSLLSTKIGFYLAKYDVGGKEEAYGRKSNYAYINGLRRYAEYLTTLKEK